MFLDCGAIDMDNNTVGARKYTAVNAEDESKPVHFKTFDIYDDKIVAVPMFENFDPNASLDSDFDNYQRGYYVTDLSDSDCIGNDKIKFYHVVFKSDAWSFRALQFFSVVRFHGSSFYMTQHYGGLPIGSNWTYFVRVPVANISSIISNIRSMQSYWDLAFVYEGISTNEALACPS